MALLDVGTTPIVAVPTNRRRAKVRFQNTGNTILYFTRQVGITPNIPSATNYDFLIDRTGGDANDAFVDVKSIAQYNVVSSGAKGTLAILETVYV